MSESMGTAGAGESVLTPSGGPGSSVRLRPVEASDWPIVHTWASLPEVCQFQPWGPNSEDETREFVATAARAWQVRPQIRFAYLVLADGRPIGMGEVQVRNTEHRQGEISYVLHPSVWRQGYGTSLARSLVAIGFQQLKLHRLTATCDPRNAASATVIRHAGFRYEGRMRDTQLIRTGWRDSYVFGILESWQRPEPR